MGGKVYDRKPLVVDRDPSKTLAVEVGKFNKPNPVDLALAFGNALLDYGLDAFKNVTGIDLKSWTSFLDDLPGFDAGKIISGIFSGGLIPGLDASKIVSGVFNTVVIPFLDAGKIISGVFTGGLIPGLDASKIVSGQFPQSIIAGLTGLLSAFPGANIVGSIASNLLSGAINAAIIPALDASKIVTGVFQQSMVNITNIAAGIVSGIFGAAQIPALDASKITTGTFAQSAVAGLTSGLADLGSGIQGTLNGIVNSLQGATGAFWTQADANAALKAQAAALAAAAAVAAVLQGSGAGDTGGGIAKFVEFTTFADSKQLPGAVFSETYSAGDGSYNPTTSYGIVSGSAQVTENENFYKHRSVIAEYRQAVTVTDYQKVGGVWSAGPGLSYQNPTPFFTPAPYYNPYGAEHVLYCRYKDYLNWTRIRFTANGIGAKGTLFLETCVAGTVTEMTSVGHVFQPSTAYYLEAGLGGGSRIFRVSQGPTPILTYTDSANVSQMGAAFRGGALGASWWGAGGAGVPAVPGPLIAFILQDNNPNNMVFGKQARFYRANGAAVGVSTGDAAPVPNSFFDTVDYNVGGIFTYGSAGNCRITVSEKGLYQVTTRIGWNAGNVMDCHLWKGSGAGAAVLHKQGNASSWMAGGSWLVNLAAGDFVQIALKSNGGGGTGSADGTATYLEIRQVLSGA